MRMIALRTSLIVVAFELIYAKTFDQCELAVELFEKHKVPRDEIYKHLCIVSTLHTEKNVGDHLGIYGIGSKWWCGEDEPSGGCNVTCSDLLDDDIADDVACANLILSKQGVEAWFEKTVDTCMEHYVTITDTCLAQSELLHVTEQDETLRKAKEANQIETIKERENSSLVLWVIAVILIALVAALIAGLVAKFKPFTVTQTYYPMQNEFKNTWQFENNVDE